MSSRCVPPCACLLKCAEIRTIVVDHIFPERAHVSKNLLEQRPLCAGPIKRGQTLSPSQHLQAMPLCAAKTERGPTVIPRSTRMLRPLSRGLIKQRAKKGASMRKTPALHGRREAHPCAGRVARRPWLAAPDARSFPSLARVLSLVLLSRRRSSPFPNQPGPGLFEVVTYKLLIADSGVIQSTFCAVLVAG